MMRCSLTSPEEKKGLPGTPAPVAGSMRRMAPFKRRGSPNARNGALAAQRPALGGRRRLVAAHAGRGIAAGILRSRSSERSAVLAPVVVVEARALAARDVEIAVRAEVQAPDRVARELLTPVVDELVLARGPVRPGRRQPRQPAADDAAVRGRSRRRRAAVGRAVAGTPARRRAADRRVVGVQHVHEVVRREVRVDRESEQSAVPEVVDLGPEVCDHRVGVGVDVREQLQQAALLGHEHAPVGQKADRRSDSSGP